MMLDLITAAIDIPHHLSDSHEPVFLFMTKHMLVMSIATLFTMAVLLIAARGRSLVPKGVSNLIEPVLLFIRDEVVYPATGEKTGRRLLPFFWTLFFFILANNLIGLIPFSATPTGNFAVTATLSIIAFIVIQIVGVALHGPVHHIKNIAPAVPWWIYWFIFIIELIGMFAKHFALAVRLLANMLAGHMVILGFISLILIVKSVAVGGVVTLMIVAISILEVFIAFLQAYIFTFLTAMFVGSAVEGH